MLKKYPASTLIIIGCIIISLASIYNNLFWVIHFTESLRPDPNVNKYLVKSMLDPLHLDWAFSRNSTLNINGNYINCIFELLLLAGVILYMSSRQKETRLIRFVASVVLIDNVMGFVKGIIFLITNLFTFKSFKPADTTYFFIYIGFYIANLLWLFLSYKTLQYFKAQKELQTGVYGEGEAISTYYIEASKWQRVAHLVIDLFIALFILSPIIYIYKIRSQSPFGGVSTLSETDWIIIVFGRLIYYFLFEYILGTTPGKLLTETRVIDYEGNKPSLKKVAKRTISRLIPFESISFYTLSGLHDKLSETLVVKEKRTGFEGAVYLLIIPAVIAYLYVVLSSPYN